jgi:hypothetical protein
MQTQTPDEETVLGKNEGKETQHGQAVLPGVVEFTA